MTELEAAWDEVHAANEQLRWQVGRPYFHDECDCWEQYAFDPTERPRVGKRSREWIAIGPTEAECVRNDGAPPSRARRRALARMTCH